MRVPTDNVTSLHRIDGGADGRAAVIAVATAIGGGRLVVLIDAAADEAHLVTGARVATTHALATMATYGRGVLRVALAPERIAALGAVPIGGDGLHAPVDLAGSDRPAHHRGRAATVRALADPTLAAPAFSAPGHVFPVRVAAGGCLERRAVAEAAADLAGIVCGERAAVHVAAVDEAGAPATADAGRRLARVLGVDVVAVAQVAAHRERVEPAVERVVAIDLPTRDGPLSAVAFRGRRHAREYTAFVRGALDRRHTRVHVHLTCLPGDVFGGGACACGEALTAAREQIARRDDGVVVHVEHGAPFRHVRGGSEDPVPAGLELDVAHLLRQLCVRSATLSSNEPLDPAPFAAAGVAVRPATPDGAGRRGALRRVG